MSFLTEVFCAAIMISIVFVLLKTYLFTPDTALSTRRTSRDFSYYYGVYDEKKAAYKKYDRLYNNVSDSPKDIFKTFLRTLLISFVVVFIFYAPIIAMGVHRGHQIAYEKLHASFPYVADQLWPNVPIDE